MEEEKKEKPDLFVNTKKHDKVGDGFFHCYRCDLNHIFSGKSPSCEYFKFYDEIKRTPDIMKF